MDGQEALARLEAATQVAQRAVEGVGEGDWAAPSTCEAWSVEEVVRHLVEGNERLAASLTAEDAASPDAQAGTWPERHRASAAALVDAMRRPGALDQPVTVPAGTMPGLVVAGLRTVESLVHGWDIATSTGQRLEVPDDLVEHADRLTRQLLEQIPPDRRPFKAPTTPPPAVGPLDLLAALLGRQVRV